MHLLCEGLLKFCSQGNGNLAIARKQLSGNDSTHADFRSGSFSNIRFKVANNLASLSNRHRRVIKQGAFAQARGFLPRGLHDVHPLVDSTRYWRATAGGHPTTLNICCRSKAESQGPLTVVFELFRLLSLGVQLR